jgi:hypothetical protein
MPSEAPFLIRQRQGRVWTSRHFQFDVGKIIDIDSLGPSDLDSLLELANRILRAIWFLSAAEHGIPDQGRELSQNRLQSAHHILEQIDPISGCHVHVGLDRAGIVQVHNADVRETLA